MSDSIKIPAIKPDEARELAINFINKYSPVKVSDSTNSSNRFAVKGSFKESNVQETVKQGRTDYKFNWRGKSAVINKDIIVSTVVSGNTVSDFNVEFEIPGEVATDVSSTFSLSTVIPFYIVVFILIIVTGYKRIRAYEISFRLAVIMGLLVALTFGINLYSQISGSTGWELWMPVIFSTIFISGGVFITWAVSETIAREASKEKFISLDLLTKGYLFHSKVGKAGINGFTAGFLIYLAWMILLLVSENILHISFVTKQNSSLISHFSSLSPSLNIANKSIYPQVFYTAIFFLFIFTGLKRRFASLYILVPIAVVLWAVMNYNDILPLYWGILTGIVIGVLFFLFYNYSDVLSVLIALSVYSVIDTAVSLFTNGNHTYLVSGYSLVIFFVLVSAYFITGIFTKDKITDYNSITPAFVKNITERQRMQRELEIARDVQMSFLPAKNPQFKGLDIAAKCIPALEVGGDYYDFVNLDENRMGIIIGDVSGKGTQAAFYMTLAKGFVKALSKTVSSPSEFLVKINELFYENVERGTFISMIYGIFDVEKKTLTFSRAGHNPVIAKHSGKNEIELLNPVGLALGLEKGTIFNRTIKEIKIDMHPGDTFVFYTDGFTEAMNKFKLEFTEQRLTETISQNIELTANELLEKTIADVKTFTGKTLQHDDMTMVVVKVL